MTAYILRRAADLGIVLLGMSLLVFLMIRLIPGDAVAIMLGANTEITDAGLNELRERLGLDPTHPNPILELDYRCTAR